MMTRSVDWLYSTGMHSGNGRTGQQEEKLSSHHDFSQVSCNQRFMHSHFHSFFSLVPDSTFGFVHKGLDDGMSALGSYLFLRIQAAVCLVLDVGIHMSACINEAVECLKLLLQRKFFAEKREEVALILCGTSATANDLADAGGNFSHISMVRELSPLDWDILEFLNNHSFLTTDEADVIDALLVAMSHLVSKCEYAPLFTCSPDCFLGCRNRRGIQEKRVLLISNLEGPASNAHIAKISDDLRMVDIQLSLIGCDVHTKPIEEVPSSGDVCAPGTSARTLGMNSAKLTPACKAVTDLWCQFNGESYTFDEAIPALAFFETRDVIQRGWPVNLDIGDSLRLPVVGYTQVKEAHPPSLKLLYAANPATPVRLMTSYHAQDAAATELKPTEVVRGRFAFSLLDVQQIGLF
ncbi:hypothetical protein PHET_10436 [Paragonimus heterotremus]|uniref:Ku70/Ku80 N-terminal alpha/beta domain-containing protein n=1 Tax=Paragonimus heterotremus TaxID=100268 RepID=A0A8J4WN57_9TREM|nr:hypothetical protein PHET_10436 [Paragonimus heterotremus]